MNDEAKYKEAAIVLGIGGLGMIFVSIIGVSILFAWIRATIWNWFAVPYLRLPHLSVWVMLALGAFTSTYSRTDLATKEYKGFQSFIPVVASVGFAMFALAVAAIIHHCLGGG